VNPAPSAPTDPNPPLSNTEIHRTLKSVRFAGVMFLLILSYFAVRLSLSMSSFRIIFDDMLEGKALPLATQIALRGKLFITGLCLSIPIVAVATIFLSDLRKSFLLIAWAALAVLVLIILLCEALTAPLIGLIDQLG
jgi:hypothetical protein